MSVDSRFRSHRNYSDGPQNFHYSSEDETRDESRKQRRRWGEEINEAPPFVYFDTDWNSHLLGQELPCTSHLGKKCEPTSPLLDLMQSALPRRYSAEWNAFHLQSAPSALQFRNNTAEMISDLSIGIYQKEAPQDRREAGAYNNPPYVIRPPTRDGVYPVLYEMIITAKQIMVAQAIDPLLYLHGEEQLRVVQFKGNEAKEVVGGCDFDPTQTSPGDLLWVYRLCLNAEYAGSILDLGEMVRDFETLISKNQLDDHLKRAREQDNPDPSNGRYPVRCPVNLDYFNTRKYLVDVKNGNHPLTMFQIAEYALVTPHTDITSRLARVHIPTKLCANSSVTVVVEGEVRHGRIDEATLRELKLRERGSHVFRVFFRTPHPSIPHFSAPPRNGQAIEQIAEMLKRDRDYLTLMPDLIGFSGSERASDSVDKIVKWKKEMGVRPRQWWYYEEFEEEEEETEGGKQENEEEDKEEEEEEEFDDSEDSLHLGEDGWREAVEVVKLGETGLRHEAMSRLDRSVHKVTLDIIKRAKTTAIAKIQMKLGQDEGSHHLKTLANKGQDRKERQKEGREQREKDKREQEKRQREEKRRAKQLVHSWSDKGRRVALRRDQSEDWMCGSIVKSELKDTLLTVLISFDASELRKDVWELEMEVKLDRSVPSKLNDLMLGKPLNIERGSNGEKVMQTVYKEILGNGVEPEILPPISSTLDSIPATFRREFLWTEEQREVIARGPSLDLVILNVDAGAGTGKTTAIVGAIDQTLMVHGEGTLIIAVAVTNVAVETLVEKMLSIGSERMKVTRLPGREGAPADLLEQIIACARDGSAPVRLQRAAEELRSLTNQLRRMQDRQADESLMDTGNLDQCRHLQRDIEKKRDAASGDFLSHQRPNVLALTLDTLIIAMSGDGAVRDYIEKAERVFLWMDEAGQAPELTLAAISKLLPNAYQRHVGDRRQLPPQHHHHYNDNPFDAQLAGSVSMTLSRSAHTPTLRLRQCHRMHPALLNVSSSLFYANTLKGSVTEEERELHESIHLPDRSFPLCIITTGGEEKKAVVGFSIGNRTQERVAVDLVKKLLEPAYGRDVAILSCYRESVDRIRKDYDVPCTVTTVDSAMGAEFEVVVVLTTRSSREEYRLHEASSHRRFRKCRSPLSFIEDARRVNVALTRARKAVFIIGEHQVWSRAKNWQKVYDMASERGNVLRWPEAMEKLKKSH